MSFCNISIFGLSTYAIICSDYCFFINVFDLSIDMGYIGVINVFDLSIGTRCTEVINVFNFSASIRHTFYFIDAFNLSANMRCSWFIGVFNFSTGVGCMRLFLLLYVFYLLAKIVGGSIFYFFCFWGWLNFSVRLKSGGHESLCLVRICGLVF